MRTFTVISALALGACTFNWSGGDGGLPLVGSEPPLSSFTRLNAVTSGRASLLTGPDGASWAALCEFWTMGSGNNGRGCQRMHLVRLGAPDEAPREETIDADSFALHGAELYEIRDDAAGLVRTVTMHRPGDAAVDDVAFSLPAGRAAFFANDAGASDVFLYWLRAAETIEWVVCRRDRRYQRRVPLPPGSDPTGDDDARTPKIVLTADGGTIVVRGPDGVMVADSTLDEGTVALGPRPADFFIDEPRAAAVAFGEGGATSVALDGSGDRLLTADPIARVSVAVDDDVFYYATPAGLSSVPLDGSRPARLEQPGAARLRAVGRGGELAYGLDPADRYAGGAGDGWIGGWRFMERGRQLRFSADGARLHFLEHAATLGTYGDLTTATSPAAPPRTLAINVHRWDELPDGRLLAIENAVVGGAWNRLVVIDEVAGERRWLVPTATEFLLVPGSRDLLVDVVSGATGYDVLRVPAP